MEEEGYEFILPDLPPQEEEDQDFKFNHILNEPEAVMGDIKRLTGQSQKGKDDLEIVGEIKQEIKDDKTQMVENPITIQIEQNQQTAHMKSSGSGGVQKYMCSICNVDFGRNWEKLSSHEPEAHPQIRPFKCTKCPKSFKLARSLEKHLENSHTGVGRKHVCSMCGVDFGSNWTKLTSHEMEAHPLLRPFKCTQCTKTFKFGISLRNHMKNSHAEVGSSGEKPYKCDSCPKTFKSEVKLRMHKKVPCTQKPKVFVCAICGFKTERRANIIKHMYVHNRSVPKPYPCSECTESFVANADLKRHMRIHTGEKPFACHLCDRRYLLNQHLLDHKKAIHKIEYPVKEIVRRRRRQ